LEEKARQIASDVTETGKQAVKDAADQLSPVVDKAMTKSKEEARSAVQEVGIDPDKLTASKPSTTPPVGQAAGMNTGQAKAPALNRDTLSGQWKQVKGDVKGKWGQLTDDDITQVEGDYEKLIGVLQTRYGYTREHVEREISEFFNSRKSQV